MPDEMSDEAKQAAAEAADVAAMGIWHARLLDLRTWICGLFLIFGVTVTAMGIAPEQAELDRAAGININLWAGLSMLGLAIVMGGWAIAAPPDIPEPAVDPNELPAE